MNSSYAAVSWMRLEYLSKFTVSKTQKGVNSLTIRILIKSLVYKQVEASIRYVGEEGTGTVSQFLHSFLSPAPSAAHPVPTPRQAMGLQREKDMILPYVTPDVDRTTQNRVNLGMR